MSQNNIEGSQDRNLGMGRGENHGGKLLSGLLSLLSSTTQGHLPRDNTIHIGWAL